MVNYQNGKVYCIRSNQTEKVYIGSTIDSLCRRLAKHRYEAKHRCNNKTTSFYILQFEDAYIELVENYPCNSKEELHKREGEIMRQYNNRVNKALAGRTQKQYRDEHKEILKQKDKQYREDNKEILKEKSKLYRDEHKDEKKQKDKQYREDNKEILKEKSKIKYENNKEKIKERSKKRYEKIGKKIIVCECNMNTTIGDQSTHRKSKKHLEILSNKQNKCECGLILQHTSPSHITRHNKSKIHIQIMNNIFYKKIYDFIYS